LSKKPPSERTGLAHWLQQRDCSACWRAGRGENQAREEWLAEQRSKESTEIDAWELGSQMPELVGTEKAVAWAARVRYTLMGEAYDWRNDREWSDEEFALRLESPARERASASWWIDQRDSAPEDLEELLTDGVSTGDARFAADNGEPLSAEVAT
jgi:hypothetical protein